MKEQTMAEVTTVSGIHEWDDLSPAKQKVVGKHMDVIREEGYESVTFTGACDDHDNCFYFVAFRNDVQIELYTQQEDTNLQLWRLDDFGASTENEGDWLFESEFTI